MTESATNAPSRSRRWWWWLVRATVGVLTAVTICTVAANVLVRVAARPFLHVLASEVTAPVAIVPGASVRRDGAPSRQLSERLATALALIRAGRVDRILVSGARNGAYDEAGPMRKWLTQRGIDASLVIDDHAGFRTLDTMERAARVYAVRRAVICTQAFHLPRAVFLARRAGIDAVGLTADGGSRGPSAATTVRESLADLMAVIDTYLLDRQPRVPGPRQARQATEGPGSGG